MEPQAVERTFLFVDLAGFSALTEAHGDADAVALLDRFLALTRDCLADGDELVKSIGDAVMLASPTPAAGLVVLRRIWAACAGATGFPLPRAGAHHGSAIAREGDYLGAAVNLAARVAAHAGGGQALATREVADTARAEGVEVVELGAHRLRNLAEAVELYEIRLGRGEAADSVDPVCRMRVESDHAAGSLIHREHRFWFCSLACVAAFCLRSGPLPAGGGLKGLAGYVRSRAGFPTGAGVVGHLRKGIEEASVGPTLGGWWCAPPRRFGALGVIPPAEGPIIPGADVLSGRCFVGWSHGRRGGDEWRRASPTRSSPASMPWSRRESRRQGRPSTAERRWPGCQAG